MTDDKKNMGRGTKIALRLLRISDIKGKTKLVRNEKRKLRAIFCNSIGIGIFVGFSVWMNTRQRTPTWLAATAFLVIGALCWIIHWSGALWLNDLEE